MGALVGLLFGAGVVLMLSAWSAPLPQHTRPTRTSALRRDLDEAGLASVPVRGLVGMSVVAALLAFGLIMIASRTLPVALLFMLAAGAGPRAVVRSRARRRRSEFAEVWPEAVDHLSSAVRAGMALPEALGALGTRGPEALRPAFAQFALDHQVSGQFSTSLDRLKVRLSDPVGDRVVEALRVARDVGGGDLGRLLRSLSGYLRDDARTRAELVARQSWTVNGARLAVSAPWLVLLLMCFQPEVIQRYSSTTGALVLASGAGACVLAYRLMMRLGRLPVEKRILA